MQHLDFPSKAGIVVDAPLKLNLALHVVGQRADGYHLLESLVTFIAKGDEIHIEKAPLDSFVIDGPYGAGLQTDDDNLVIKARNLLRAQYGAKAFPVAIRLTKNLPIASGVGGGSADAAATLGALQRLWDGDLEYIPKSVKRFSDQDVRKNKELEHDCGSIFYGRALERQSLYRLSLSLGADVPMCLYGFYEKTAIIARGIGEEIEKLSHFPSLDLVLANPGVGVSTPAVFSALACRTNPPLQLGDDDLSSYESLICALRSNRNDLYLPAARLVPQLAPLLWQFEQCGADLARMSGSGATCFAIFPDSDKAAACADHICALYPDYFVMHAKTVGA